MTVVYFILMAGIVLFYIIINSSVKQRYCEELEPLDDRQYACKGLLPFGLWVFDEIHIPSAGAYVIYLYQRVVMVYGTRYAVLPESALGRKVYEPFGDDCGFFLGAVSNSGLGFTCVPFPGHCCSF